MLVFFLTKTVLANAIDSLEMRLRNCPVQEKIYVHTDNNAYFIGDTIWYKAYAVRADNNKKSDISRIVYIELLTPDGYTVERQRIIVNGATGGCGQFALKDSLYSGYYEIRAYTRWQLNFNYSNIPYSQKDEKCFFNAEMANNYFKSYEELFSRVIPIYEKPKQSGNYTDRWIKNRPLRHVYKEEKEGLNVKFYPEGGAIVCGLRNNVAFEILDLHGKPLKLTGKLGDGTIIESDEDGRGMFSIIPRKCSSEKATFSYQGKEYAFPLPQPGSTGGIIAYDILKDSIIIQSTGIRLGAVAVTCRGSLVRFCRLQGDSTFFAGDFPTGVDEITLYDEKATPLASRFIFVNNHDCSRKSDVRLFDENHENVNVTESVTPFQSLTLEIKCENESIKNMSVSVCDSRGDIQSYDDGNLMTYLLLESDLRGFVAHPSYYFESDDFEHKSRLNLLLMIQGWRKYAPLAKIKYQPEKNFLIKGEVFKINNLFKTPDLQDLIWDNCSDKTNPCFFGRPDLLTLRQDFIPIITANDTSRQGKDSILRLETEIIKGNDYLPISIDLDSSKHFAFQIPSFYNNASLFMTAYERRDSARSCLASKSDSHKLDPLYSPNYYIKRECFYPHFSRRYVWRQTHYVEDYWESLQYDADRVLDNVVVQSRRRRNIFKKDKPLMVIDFLDFLNQVTDDGLYWGPFNGILFWEQASRSLFGNMGDPEHGIKIRASVQGHIFLKKYVLNLFNSINSVGERMTPVMLRNRLLPCNIWKVKVYCDYSMRDGIGKSEKDDIPDVWYELIPFPENGRRTIWRDRMMLLDGFAYPEQFYHRDYSGAALPDSSDYRRTLYWNPNAHSDKDGNLNIQFYNGARPAHLKVSICGVGEDGKIYYY